MAELFCEIFFLRFAERREQRDRMRGSSSWLMLQW